MMMRMRQGDNPTSDIQPCIAFCQICGEETPGAMVTTVAMLADGEKLIRCLAGRSECCGAPIRANWPQDEFGSEIKVH